MSDVPTTQWSLIRASTDGEGNARQAWEALLVAYQRPVRAFFRRSPLSRDSDDLTQAFIEQSIAGGWWGRADPDRGTFRSFLYLLLRRFLAKRLRDRSPDGETLSEEAPAGAGSLAHAFDVAFVLRLTEQALAQLRADYEARRRTTLFEALLPLLNDPPTGGALKQRAEELALRPNTLTVELRRLRQRVRKGMELELRQLCLDDEQFDRELEAVRTILAGDDVSHSDPDG